MFPFNDNKYTRWYLNIVNNPTLNDGYTELHHIIPRSMGGSDEASNLVRVTAKQHFVLHRLLVKMVKKQHLSKAWCGWRALALMPKRGVKPRITSRQFEKLREEHAAHVSTCMKAIWNDLAARELFLQRVKSSRKISWREAALKASTPQVSAKKSESAKKRRWSEETKRKMSETRKALYADPEKRLQAIERSKATKIANGTTEKEIAARLSA